jgi:hypothetical protein
MRFELLAQLSKIVGSDWAIDITPPDLVIDGRIRHNKAVSR